MTSGVAVSSPASAKRTLVPPRSASRVEGVAWGIGGQPAAVHKGQACLVRPVRVYCVHTYGAQTGLGTHPDPSWPAPGQRRPREARNPRSGMLVLVVVLARSGGRRTCGGWILRRERGEQCLAVRTAQPGTGVPARPGRVAAVVALGDVVEGRLADLVERGVHVARGTAQRLVAARQQRGPQRRHRAGAADHFDLAVHAHLVAGERVGVARHVGYAAAGEAVRRLRHAGALLPCGQRIVHADTAAGGAFVAGSLVPHRFAGDRAGAGGERGATAGQRIRAGGGEVHVRLAVALAIAGTAVARGGGHRDAERGGVLQRALHRGERGRAPAVLRAAPADRDHRGLARGVVRRLRDRLVETLVGVRREVHRDRRA